MESKRASAEENDQNLVKLKAERKSILQTSKWPSDTMPAPVSIPVAILPLTHSSNKLLSDTMSAPVSIPVASMLPLTLSQVPKNQSRSPTLEEVTSTASNSILDVVSSQKKAFTDQSDKDGYVMITITITLSQDAKPERWEMCIVEFVESA